MSVTIRVLTMIETDDAGEKTKAPYQYIVSDPDRHLTFGVFTVGDDGTAAEAKQKANDLLSKLEETPWISPFVTHRQVLLADYGGAQKLARLTLSLYNGTAFPFDVGLLGGLDTKHFEMAITLLRSYHQFGENDTDFMAACEAIKRAWEMGEYAPEKQASEAD
jgi:hypothetical protein